MTDLAEVAGARRVESLLSPGSVAVVCEPDVGALDINPLSARRDDLAVIDAKMIIAVRSGPAQATR